MIIRSFSEQPSNYIFQHQGAHDPLLFGVVRFGVEGVKN